MSRQFWCKPAKWEFMSLVRRLCLSLSLRYNPPFQIEQSLSSGWITCYLLKHLRVHFTMVTLTLRTFLPVSEKIRFCGIIWRTKCDIQRLFDMTRSYAPTYSEPLRFTRAVNTTRPPVFSRTEDSLALRSSSSCIVPLSQLYRI